MKTKIIKAIILLLISINTFLSFSQKTIAEDNKIKVDTTVSFEGVISGCTENSCEIKSGIAAIGQVLGGIIKYITFIVGLLAVLFIVVNGIMYSMGGMDQSMKEEAKKRITKTIIGIIVLLMTGTILKLIAPWIYK